MTSKTVWVFTDADDNVSAVYDTLATAKENISTCYPEHRVKFIQITANDYVEVFINQDYGYLTKCIVTKAVRDQA